MIPRLQEANCAKLMRPKDDFDRVLGADVQSALERLPPRHHLNFWRFYVAALKAEVEAGPLARAEAPRTCRADRAGSLCTQHQLPKGEERVGLVPPPDLWAGRITYMVRFVKVA